MRTGVMIATNKKCSGTVVGLELLDSLYGQQVCDVR